MPPRKKTPTPPPAPAPQVQRNQPPPNAPRFIRPEVDVDTADSDTD